jgi:hypothetical protein
MIRQATITGYLRAIALLALEAECGALQALLLVP